MNPIISEAKYAVSVYIAIEFAKYPPINYITKNIIDIIQTNLSFFKAFLY
jgi:hypothetical protein